MKRSEVMEKATLRRMKYQILNVRRYKTNRNFNPSSIYVAVKG